MREKLITLIVHHVLYKGWQFGLDVINFHRKEANDIRVAKGSTIRGTIAQCTTKELNEELYRIMANKYNN